MPRPHGRLLLVKEMRSEDAPLERTILYKHFLPRALSVTYTLPALSATIPEGEPIEADVESVAVSPDNGKTARILRLVESATKITSPAYVIIEGRVSVYFTAPTVTVVTVIPIGVLKRALTPEPSDEPADAKSPAIVVTLPSATLILRIIWLFESVTYTRALSPEKVTPCGTLNAAFVPAPSTIPVPPEPPIFPASVVTFRMLSQYDPPARGSARDARAAHRAAATRMADEWAGGASRYAADAAIAVGGGTVARISTGHSCRGAREGRE